MAINFSIISSGFDEVPGTSATDADTTTVPGSNHLVKIAVLSVMESASTPNQPTVTGKGLGTFVPFETQLFTNGATYNARLTVLHAMAASPTAAQIVIDFGGQTQDAVLWAIIQSGDVDTSGSNGAGALVQSDAATGNGTSASAVLAAFADAINNATVYAVAAAPGTASITPEGGMTAFAQVDSTSYSLRLAWRLGEDLSPSATIGASRDWAVIAAETKAAAGGGGGDVGNRDFDAYLPLAAPAPGPCVMVYG